MFIEDRNIPNKKVNVQVGACQTLIFSAKLQQKVSFLTDSVLDFHFLGPRGPL